MALAIDASSPALATVGGTNTTLTTASFTPPAGSQLWAGMAANNDQVGGTLTASSSPSLTWTQRIFTGGQEAPAAWSWANVSTSQSYTVTCTRQASGPNPNPGMSLYVVVVTGTETTPGGATATNSSNSGTPSQTITTTRAGSLILAAVGDWAQRGLGTAGTSQTILAEHNIAGDYTSHFWRYDGFPAVSTYTINLTAPTLQDYCLSIVEIREPVVTYAPNTSRYLPRGDAVRRAATF